ncbi:MAG: hypothetical protein CSYNP_04211 [Syntrophus sp. SKADARSKE-3]|nr:hypothetical protein [Syntrophus sp. SKADARSKE-3]
MKRAVKIFSVVLSTALAFMSGCSGIGPVTVPRDHFDYTVAISESWKRQMLLNMVKMRYGDVPIFMDVASVINQYALEQEIALGAESGIYNRSTASYVGPFFRAGGKYADRPTITYTPLVGERFAKRLMTPISPNVILHLIQSGFPVDMVFRFAVNSINGIQNRFGGQAKAHSADLEFYPLIQLLRKIQDADALGISARKLSDQENMVIFFKSKSTLAIQEEIKEVKKILGLNPKANEFNVVYGSSAMSDTEISIQPRFMIEIITDLASYIHVPYSHVSAKRVNLTFKDEPTVGIPFIPLIQIYSSPQKPEDAFVSIHYRNHWFFINDNDLPSKRVFSCLMFAITLTETGIPKDGIPIVTIPTN